MCRGMYGKAANRGNFARRSNGAVMITRAARGSGFRDIHKYLWINVWIVDE